MNKTFKVIFSKTRGALVAVNEAAKTTSRASVKTAVAGVCAALLSVPAMAAGFTDYCKDGNCVVDGQTVEGNGSVVILDSNSASNKVQSITIKNSTISNTPFELRGSQKISVSDTVFTGLVSGTKRSFWIYAHNGYKTDVATEKATEVELNNVTFKDNTVSYGSLFVYDKTKLHMKGGAFVKNVTTDIGGGAMIKSGTIVFEDVLFQDNVAKNESKTTYAAGGAVYVDITTGIKQNGKDSVGDVTFKLTKDMAYTGNRIDSPFEGTADTYDWYAYPSGGFLFLDRSSKGAFDIADGVTLTIGTASATGEDDSIASALPNTKEQDPGYSTLVKKGAGTVVMYGSMDKYFGDFTVEAGTFDVRKAWTSLGNTTVTGGVLSASNGITLNTVEAGTGSGYIQSGKLTVSGEGTVTVKSLKLANSAETTDKDRLPFVRIEKGGTLRADTIDVAANAGTVTLAGGTLETGSAQVYDLATKSVINADASKVSSENDLNGLALKAGITATSGTLALTDKGYYTTASLKAMSGALKAGSASLSFLNSKLYKAAGETAELVDSVIQSTEQVTTSSEVKTNADGKATAQVTVKNSGAQTVVVKDSAQKDAKAVDQVTFAAPASSTGEMTLVGSAAGGYLVQNTAGKAVDVEVAPGLTLNLGQTELPEQTTGTLSNLTLSTGTTDTTGKAAGLTVANIVATVEKLVAAGNNLVTVGNERKRGVLKIGTLDLGADSKVFVDPAWQNDAALNTIGNASHLEIAQVGSLQGSLIAGQNSLITIGATAAQAEAAFNQAGLNWGKEAVSAALYLGTSVNPEGGILVNGSLTDAGATAESGTVTLAAGSLLMVDAAAVGEKAVTGTVSAADGAKVALVNAAEGTFKLADTVTGLTSASFVSDNLFTTTALNGSDVSTTVDKNALGGAVASMGLQSMIRRADSVLAATVADRTSIDQELGAGANLWVDVGGESYEADGFDNNARFKSDMGYGVFGADVAVSDDITLGAALQYGTGSARSSNFGMKNEIDTWGLTAYSVYKTGDARFVGEVAYVKAKNDISASAASKLSQSVDTEMLSAGMSAHYQFDAGAVTVTPSLGIRLSQLKTDALKVGAIRIADDEMTVFQVPVAVRVGMKPVEASGWNIAPAVKLAYVPTFGDDETDILGYQQKVLDTSPVQADIGVEARKGNFMVNVNFLAGTGSEGAKAVGGKVGVKYLF
ncbi:autotransporter domain-containing protein [uncultured Duodenibacillus sp.]|uniref:autotransporter domain-containing protein n=1 Tax=uncultured Duodenibacillus sp. TaxID=1980699 RepID=UPI002598ABD3|nr:autotransporter domain-containing protein [uncultured Duodenibacillus sp.]